jgi:hypothetical protein
VRIVPNKQKTISFILNTHFQVQKATYDGNKQKKNAAKNATTSYTIPGGLGVAVIAYTPPEATPAPLSKRLAMRRKRYKKVI